MTYEHTADDLIMELDSLRAYGVSVSDAAYTHVKVADLRLLSLLDRRDAALLILRRASSQPLPKQLR
ncbi:hypothetical protein MCEMAEM21_00376 [Oxalobacteraceae bacterium]|jgi:hypothetical protein